MKNMQLCCFVIILCKSLGWKSLKINDWNQVWRLTENSHYLWLHCFPLVLYIGTVKLNKIIFFPRTYSLNSIQTLLFMWLVHPTRSTLRILFMSSWLGISNSFVFRLKDCVCVCVRACERAHAHAYNPVTKAVVTDTQGLTDRRWLKNASGCISVSSVFREHQTDSQVPTPKDQVLSTLLAGQSVLVLQWTLQSGAWPLAFHFPFPCLE